MTAFALLIVAANGSQEYMRGATLRANMHAYVDADGILMWRNKQAAEVDASYLLNAWRADSDVVNVIVVERRCR